MKQPKCIKCRRPAVARLYPWDGVDAEWFCESCVNLVLDSGACEIKEAE